MSVLIRGMEMPNACYKCELYESETYWCRGAKRDVEDPFSDGGVATFCPLIFVPPHGALMDRDDFFAACPELVDGYKFITDFFVVIPAEEGE